MAGIAEVIMVANDITQATIGITGLTVAVKNASIGFEMAASKFTMLNKTANSIGQGFTAVKNKTTSTFSALGQSINNAANSVGQGFTTIKNKTASTFTAIGQSISKRATTISQGFAGIKSKLTPELMALKGTFGNVAISVGKGFVYAMTELGKASWSAAEQSTASMNIIQIGTGATGEQLKGLMSSYEKVGSQVPDNLSLVATVISDVNKKTGATGPTLEVMAKRIMDLGTLTGVSSSTISTSLTGAMQSWGIGADQGSEMFDKMFYLSQKTGIGVNTLADKLTKFGGPMRELGFDFDTSAALVGQWTKQGLDADMVLKSFTTALGNMSKVGVKDTNQALTIAINKIKQAGTTAQATKLGIEAFGQESGPSMAAAIREGRLELGTMLQEMTNSKDIIDIMAKKTETLGDKFGSLKNEMMIALAPLGKQLMGVVEKAFPAIKKIADLLKGGLERALPYVEVFASVVGSVLLVALDQVANGIDFFIKYIDILGPAVGVVALALGVGLASALWSVAVAGWVAVAPLLPFIAVGIGVAAQVAYWIMVFKNWGAITDWVAEKWTQLKNWIVSNLQAIGGFISSYWFQALIFLIVPLARLPLLFAFYWDQIKDYVLGAFSAMQSGITTAMSGMLLYLTGIWIVIKNTIGGIILLIVDLVMLDFQSLKRDFSSVMDNIMSGLAAIAVGWTIFLQGLNAAKDALIGFMANFDFRTAILAPITSAIEELTLIRERLFEIGGYIMDGLLQGITSAASAIWNTIKSVAESITTGIRNFLGIRSPSRIMMEIGVMTTEGLAVGLEDSQSRVHRASQGVAETVLAPYHPSVYDSGFKSIDALTLPVSGLAPTQASASTTASSTLVPSGSALSFSPTINITMSGDSSTAAQDIAERVKQAIQEVFESASRRQGIVGV
ncbi:MULTISPECIES: phage tail tape measure protein [unclassified Paenibacillus]|uniref:phage tail tape measure protein n=1 Tax=unclassified Paenibacillus TaxID=185978 RepID=UPI00362A52B0